MNAAPTRIAIAPAPSPTLGHESRLAPPLRSPPPDSGLLTAALLLLAVALALVWRTRVRVRRQQQVRHEPQQALLQELDRIRTQGMCPCRPCAPPAGTAVAGERRPCADRVHELLTEFATTATGLPCARLTTPELHAYADHLPTTLRAAFAHLVETLATTDRDRFSSRPALPANLCLVDAAAAAVRGWPAEATAEPVPAGSTNPT